MQAACGAYPGGSVVKNLPANAGDTGSTPGWRTKIPHALEQPGLRVATAEASLNCPSNVSACRSPHFPCNENIQVLIVHPFYPKSTDRESILFTESEIRAQTKIIFIWFQEHLFFSKIAY